jgi:hypothetical protein
MLYLLLLQKSFAGSNIFRANCAGCDKYLRKNLIFNRKIIKYIGYIYIHFIGEYNETHFSTQQ